MTVRRTALTLALLAISGLGCELVANVDREQIPSTEDASADGAASDGGTDATVDQSLDAPPSDALPDAEVEAALEAEVDATPGDAEPPEAAIDAELDTGIDAEIDAGTD